MKKKAIFFYFPNRKPLILALLIIYLHSSCTSIRLSNIKQDIIQPPDKQEITLTFSGDIMAHNINFNMKDYNQIYEDVRSILQNDDFTFGNIEMPVCNNIPLSTFPRFNVHSGYLKAAIDGGFDVFGFANNHTNDQDIKGIDGTIESFNFLKEEYAEKNRIIFSSGLKQNITDNFEPCIIEKNGWKILFLSITEILNSYGKSKDRLYYSAPTKEGRKKLLSSIEEMRKTNPCDIFILALHLYEEEYGLKVSKEKRNWFQSLAKAGVDIIWAHHPHVLQEWEIDEITLSETKTKNAVFMYSMGNFISGQRWAVNYNNPEYYREYTGDSALMQVRVIKEHGTIKAYTLKPILITNYNNKDAPVVKLFTKGWAESLPEKEKKYFLKRLELMNAYLPLNTNE